MARANRNRPAPTDDWTLALLASAAPPPPERDEDPRPPLPQQWTTQVTREGRYRAGRVTDGFVAETVRLLNDGFLDYPYACLLLERLIPSLTRGQSAWLARASASLPDYEPATVRHLLERLGREWGLLPPEGV
jgi:hypothetical protein